MDLKIYQTLCADSRIIWTKHCLERMQERDISRADVKNGIVDRNCAKRAEQHKND